MRFDNLLYYCKKFGIYVLVAVVAVTAGFFLGTAKNPEINYTSTGSIIDRSDKLDMIQQIVKKNYIGKADADAMVEAAAAAMVEAAGDQWSYYMTADEYKLYQKDVQNAYEGIGVTVQTELKDGGFVVEKVDPNSGAGKAGMQAGDVITHVEGKSVTSMTTAEARNAIRGKKGTSVELTFRRGSETITKVVSRGEIAVAVATGKLLEGNIGLVTIANFDDRCAKETIATIENLVKKGAKALVFDVRNNPGGYKHELVDLLNYLLPEGVLFGSESIDGEKTQDTSDAKCLKMPMAVLVNANSYSAAEFFAAALVEYDWAITVGEHTTGKGYFQTNIELDDGSAVHLSVGKYYTPKGVSLSDTKGIAPTIEVKLEEADAKLFVAGQLKTEDDPQVKAAVAAMLDKIN